jgi:hypothetical protein
MLDGPPRHRPFAGRSHVRLFLLQLSVVFGLLIVLLSAHLPYSALHPLFMNVSRLQTQALLRQRAAGEFLAAYSAPMAGGRSNASSALCVAVQTAVRPEPYVHRCLATVLDQRPPSVLDGVPIGVIGSDLFTSALSHLSPRVEFVAREQALSRTTAELTGLHEKALLSVSKRQWHVLQRLDYALALDWCAQRHCRACLVLENDALLAQDALSRAQLGLAELRDLEWGFVRLFRTLHFEGWAKDNWHDLGWFATFGALLSLLPPQLNCVGGRRPLKPTRPSSRAARALHALFGAVWGLLFAWLLGRQHTWLGEGWLQQRPALVDATRHGSLSSIAHVYSARVVNRLQQAIARDCCEDQEYLPIDLFIAKALAGERFYEIVPNPVQHIGARSSYARAGERAGWWDGFPTSLGFDDAKVRF